MNQPTAIFEVCHMDSNRATASSLCTAQRVPFRFELRRGDECTMVRVSGEIDIASVDEFASSIRQRFEPGRRIMADLQGVTLMGATGVGACLALQREGRVAGCEVAFINPQGLVAQVLAVLGVDTTLSGWSGTP